MPPDVPGSPVGLAAVIFERFRAILWDLGCVLQDASLHHVKEKRHELFYCGSKIVISSRPRLPLMKTLDHSVKRSAHESKLFKLPVL